MGDQKSNTLSPAIEGKPGRKCGLCGGAAREGIGNRAISRVAAARNRIRRIMPTPLPNEGMLFGGRHAPNDGRRSRYRGKPQTTGKICNKHTALGVTRA